MAERIAVLAPKGRDAEVVVQVLERGGVGCTRHSDLGALRRALEGELGGVLVTEEALTGPELDAVLDWMGGQPSWSDIPVIVLATQQAGRRSALAAEVLARLGNVVLLERPVNAETLLSAARSAIRARRRQYRTHELIDDRAHQADELRELNLTLEARVEARARELDGARETLAFALDSAGMGSWDLDLATGVAHGSLQHHRIFGYVDAPVAWSAAIFCAHVIDEDRASALEAFERAGATGAMHLVCRIVGADGVQRWIEAKGRVSATPTGAGTRLAGVVSDITEPRRIEDALRQSQKMEAIGQLTGGVAHDFNNLLTVIVGGLDMIIRRPEPTTRVVRMAESAMTAARRGEQLTQQLLAFSRRQMIRPQTLDLNRLLREFAGLARRAVGESVELELDLDEGLHAARVDPAQFESAVLNLAVNARDAMPGGGRVTVRSRNIARPASGALAAGEYVMISVSDTGEGMDPKTLGHVFEPFFTTKEVGKGSGLGLSQVYGFARSAGGDVEIESAPGRGSTVRLLFPRSNDVAREEAPEASAGEALHEAAGETVLLVDDDEQVLAMARESLQELQYTVVCARHAREALDHLESGERIDVLFSDVVMPGGMNGAELALAARRLRPELRVLLTSGYVGVGAEGERQALGDDVALLDKPYRREDLAQKLRAVLHEPR